MYSDPSQPTSGILPKEIIQAMHEDLSKDVQHSVVYNGEWLLTFKKDQRWDDVVGLGTNFRFRDLDKNPGKWDPD